MDDNTAILSNYELNLSDFALFLSVMKNPKAYRNVLSILMEEPDIELAEVKVEQVILNQSGKRAIRLDAWAKSIDDRQFNMEMQNDTKGDDVRKRSRFYQGMIDTPILKSGKETRYKNLPSTVIIFITQEDIFGLDQAKYTFTEQCEEVSGLKLNDGTKKIFFNMTSKNGSKELISVLQYIKDTRLDNPNIIVKDSRILELDDIVQEVKASEEWEAVRMNILEIGLQEGIQKGIQKGIQQGIQQKLRENVEKKLKKGHTVAEIADMLEESEETIQKVINEVNIIK